MANKYWKATALGVNEFDVRFNEQGMGFGVSELIVAETEEEATSKFFESAIVHKVARQNGVPVNRLMVHVSRTTIKAFLES